MLTADLQQRSLSYGSPPSRLSVGQATLLTVPSEGRRSVRELVLHPVSVHCCSRQAMR